MQAHGSNSPKLISFHLVSINKILYIFRSRLVVITQGSENVIVVEKGQVTQYPVTKLASEKIIDTNGAGDAFVGGFLAQLAQGKSVKDCVNCGIWAATEIIQQSGCTCPADKKYTA